MAGRYGPIVDIVVVLVIVVTLLVPAIRISRPGTGLQVLCGLGAGFGIVGLLMSVVLLVAPLRGSDDTDPWYFVVLALVTAALGGFLVNTARRGWSRTR